LIDQSNSINQTSCQSKDSHESTYFIWNDILIHGWM